MRKGLFWLNDRQWARIKQDHPFFTEHEQKAGRTIPVAVLEPEEGGDARPHTPGARE